MIITFLLSILTYLRNSEVWIVSILPLISNSSSLSSKCFETIPSALTATDITVTLMLHSFFSSLAWYKVFVYLFSFFYFHSVVN